MGLFLKRFYFTNLINKKITTLKLYLVLIIVLSDGGFKMVHYIVGIEDKAPLREGFQRNFEGAIKSMVRRGVIQQGQYVVETHETPVECVKSLLRRNVGEEGNLSTLVADFVMVNAQSSPARDARPSLYLLHDQFNQDMDTLAAVPLIIVYSGKPAREIVTDKAFELFVNSAGASPNSTPVIGYRGKSGDLQGDVVDIFGIVQSVDVAVQKLGSVEAFRVANHVTSRNAGYVLQNKRF